ncbi:unnamed protein product [Clonostachys byssicola]|uniref:Serine protease n=1 Tax=Clonostachys byssicola TaxID=160290 RepID=A0A9N9UY15_9HYPO|nr:unnamed protein product [Clonostachys byssicola]
MRWIVLFGNLLTIASAHPFEFVSRDTPQNEPYVVEKFLVTTKDDAQAVRDYWTPERLASIDHDPISTNTTPVPENEKYRGAEFNGKGDIPRTVGRLLYTELIEGSGWQDSSCTATLVRSENKATIVTAAHCLKTNLMTQNHTEWNKNILFLPGFRDDLPQVNFTINRAYVESSWVYEGLNYFNDRAFAVLNSDFDSGKAAGLVIGAAQDIQFGTEPPYGTLYNLGYPRYSHDKEEFRYGSPAFTGRRLAACYGEAEVWWRFPSDLVGFPCHMSGGSSGGPHLANFDMERGVGTVVAVNSIGDWNAPPPEQVLYEYGMSVTTSFSKLLYEAAQGVKL